LRISRQGSDWAGARIQLTRSLGYGSYRFVVRDVSHFEPAVVFALSTSDDAGPYREMVVEVSRWGESTGKNAQYVIQPYFIAANVVRFPAPPGRLAFSFAWELGRVTFGAVREPQSGRNAPIEATHSFTSGIPSPGTEGVRLNFYAFPNQRNPLQHETEVVIEKFAFLP